MGSVGGLDVFFEGLAANEFAATEIYLGSLQESPAEIAPAYE